ncbi:hypothetical protein LX87_00180 [Larkinella arboricola]|uniref:Outer membrane protein with beta-barrel domain n=1 Tax=Larkinella arboricola TaxID=643671 RepID=A0A327XCR6_LARAB|nr:hypothetical protein [Larkinella arboricola]RAK02066.1 hypothetical protein LX87_00180 [Larkinella arboricola]
MASLQELPDDELDKLFRSSAEEFEPPYNPDDWNSLRRRLDDDDRLRFLDRFIYWGLPLLLLLLTTTSLLMSPDDGPAVARTVAKQSKTALAEATAPTARPQNDSPDRSVPTETKRSEPTAAETNAPTVLNAESGPPDAVSKAATREKPAGIKAPANRPTPETASDATARLVKPTNQPGNQPDISSANERSAPGPVTGNRLARSKPLTGQTTNRTVSGQRRVKPARRALFTTNGETRLAQNRPNRSGLNTYGQAGTEKNRVEVQGNSGTGGTNTGNTASETLPFDLSGNLAYIPARPHQQPPLPALPEPDLEPMRPPVVPRIAPPAVPVIGYPALSIRVVAAPDLNFVGKSHRAARDFQAGILAEYRFLRRFTVQGGILRSVKTYRAAASDYTKPDHWYGPMYESVDAVCTVLDIPVNLRFDFLLNDRRRWFISSGVSSYIMQEEKYRYNYPYGVYPQPRYKEWNGKTGFHEWSHLNFSFGYERNFRSEGPLRRLSWQVEPFLKNPRRTTLGYGKIRLLSTGVFFSLRYRL